RDGCEAQHRQVADERDHAERELGAGEPVDQPALRHALHPEADQGDSLAEDVTSEGRVTERREAARVSPSEERRAPPAARHGAASASRCAVRVPKQCSSRRARLRYRCASDSQVYPMPPWFWMLSVALMRAALLASVFAIATWRATPGSPS